MCIFLVCPLLPSSSSVYYNKIWNGKTISLSIRQDFSKNVLTNQTMCRSVSSHAPSAAAPRRWVLKQAFILIKMHRLAASCAVHTTFHCTFTYPRVNLLIPTSEPFVGQITPECWEFCCLLPQGMLKSEWKAGECFYFLHKWWEFGL